LRQLRRENREQEFWDDLNELVESRQVTEDDLSLRNAFIYLVEDGFEAFQSFSPRNGGRSVQLIEAGIDTSAFANITGQIVYSTVLQSWENPQFIAPRLARTIPTEFDGEKIPGISELGDHADSIGEAQPYPLVGVGEEWIETPRTTKRGFIVPVTKEAVFFDRTGLVLERARNVTHWLAINKEKRVIDAATGQTSLYRRNGATAVATYGDNSGAHDWDNLSASTALQDYSDIEACELLFDGLTDPNTGEPIIFEKNQLLIPSALKFTALRIVNTTEVRTVTNTSTTSLAPNPLAGQNFELLTNAWVKARTSSATTWFYGNFYEAFAYMENWPITSVEAPSNSEMEFTHDIIARFKVSERGAVACLEPRKVVKATA